MEQVNVLKRMAIPSSAFIFLEFKYLSSSLQVTKRVSLGGGLKNLCKYLSCYFQAVCRHEVGWLMHALLTDFRNAGGDIRWMAGVHLAPPKLYALVSINNLLAHRPWLLLPQHIQVRA